MQISDHTLEVYRRDAEQKQSDLIDKHMNLMSKGNRILFRIALAYDASYDSEYDGVNDSYCRYCSENLSRGEHAEDCDIFEAREALASVWTNYVNEKERIASQCTEKVNTKIKQEEHRKEKIPCPICQKNVARCGLKEHQASPACAKKVEKSTLAAHEERTGIKCITDIYINYDGKRCKECNKPMPDAHPNAKFCSNKGKGNCKDHHHNRSTPERLERAKEFSGHNAKVRREQQQMYIVASPFQRMQLEAQLGIFDEGDPSWDAHKDC